ncbi:hypothetical protein JY97_08025 [Alkalispirochaeta odontotermitis]|nr:hypothetical protein JY97_08025 [Alkalispirochaeta odontotermitis]
MALVIKHLDSLNFNCHLFALEPKGPLRDYLRTTQVQVHSGGYSSEKSWTQKVFFLIRSQLRLQRLIRQIQPHIIHAFLPLTNFMASFAGRIFNVPLIITSKRALGTHQDRNLGWRIFDVASFRLSHWVTVNSKAVGEDTLRRDLGNAGKIRLIYNGLSFEALATNISNKRDVRETLHLGPEHKIVITVANLIPYKGHAELLKAAALVIQRFSDSIFLLVGEDRGIQTAIEQQAQDLGIARNIICLGQRKDIPDLMAASDISVLPSHEEGFSNVILESMAVGLPVVATNVGGNPEAIMDGETGWLVEPRNPQELAMKIVDLLEDPGKATKWGEAGKHRVVQNFSYEKMVAEHLKLYNLQRLQGSAQPLPRKTTSLIK